MAQYRFELQTKRRTSKAFKQATREGLFNLEWYEAHYGNFSHPLRAFEDYLHKSKFANVNPSALFDTETYLRANTDIYHAGISPLIHFMNHGRYEGRMSSAAVSRWNPVDELVPEESLSWRQQKVAICLHIFYSDFVDKFAECLKKFPINIDVFVAVSTAEIADKANRQFSQLGTVNKLKVVVTPNRGRNFGPMLVEFGKELLEYDLMCHLHSKKSLYSGREQTQWFDYLNQYLLKDKHTVKSILRLFAKNPDFGMYYPTSFWMMPSWVNHWTCNKAFANDFVEGWGIDISQDFVNYPVGGMFWARPDALLPLLSQSFTYEDFPEEPLPNDGSWLHALERSVGLLSEKQGYKQFFYYPPAGRFTSDKSQIFAQYHKHPEALFNELNTVEIVSFDIFDTVLRRAFTEPDYAKLKLGKLLTEKGVFESPETFLAARNDAELSLRKLKSFKGDVSITEVYDALANELNWTATDKCMYLELEFELDLEMIKPKDEMVNIVNRLSDAGRDVWFITDIYYTHEQVERMLRKIGINIPFKLLVSSDLGMRKDAGTMWRYVKDAIDVLGKSHIHVGDSVRSDAQICGDFGLSNMHILHPKDKWQAAGYPVVLTNPLDESQILKWGSLISNCGRYPFFGE
ncbi:rhamnan synthesis F family protein [Paraglaciecola sp. L1A13]|uniref:rhamnan synthesis F family protein n=1 Tax=Paraglaciecola sp. L1A13 TaxID=2686359 RepID=UPI001E2ED45E|nr:rhamnan synthesis F family protein [Paraglaciecola sp. L1A13]